MCFAWIHPLLFSVIYAAAAAVHLCVSCMFISFMSEKLFMCTVTTIMICAISFLLSLHCNLQICCKSSLISTVRLTRPPSLSTSKSLSFRNISSKSYKPLTSNRSVSFRLQDSFCFWNLGFLKGDLFHVRLSVHLLNMNLYAASAACVYIWWQVILWFLHSLFNFEICFYSLADGPIHWWARDAQVWSWVWISFLAVTAVGLLLCPSSIAKVLHNRVCKVVAGLGIGFLHGSVVVGCIFNLRILKPHNSSL
jgi:hypothetical protein